MNSVKLLKLHEYRASPISIISSEQITEYDGFQNKRNQRIEQMEEPSEKVNYKENNNLFIGDCCFIDSKTTPPKYLGKVKNKFENNGSTIEIVFEQHDGSIYNDIKPVGYKYGITQNTEAPNPFSKRPISSGGNKSRKSNKSRK